MIDKPEYKIGDIVYYKGFLGYVQQGIIVAASWYEEEDLYGRGWRYYVRSRPHSWIVRQKKIISKA